MASIQVHRAIGGVTDHLRVYKVVIDGRVVGSLHPGDSITAEVSPGLHELFLKIDWARSEKIGVKLGVGDIARFRCAPRGNLFTGLYWASVGRRRYIRLTRASDESSPPS